MLASLKPGRTLQKPLLAGIITWAFILAAALFFLLALAKNLQQLPIGQLTIHWLPLCGAVLLVISFILIQGLIWRHILVLLGEPRLKTGVALRIHLIASLGKYIPGKVGIVIGKYHFGHQQGLRKRALLIASMYENALYVMSGLLVSTPIIIVIAASSLDFMWRVLLPVLAIVGILAMLHPQIFRRLLDLAYRILRRPPLDHRHALPCRHVFVIMGFFVLANLLNGLAFFLFLGALTGASSGLLVPAAGIIIFSSIISMLALVFPAGVGVREGLLILLLQVHFPLGTAAIVAVASRFFFAIIDGLLAACIPCLPRK